MFILMDLMDEIWVYHYDPKLKEGAKKSREPDS